MKYIVVALLLAYFTSVFMKKKEVEVDVKAAKLEKELEANIRLHKLLMETEHHIAPAMKDEVYFDGFLNRVHFKMDPTLHTYPRSFDSVENFKSYYEKVCHESHRDNPFLSYRMASLLQDFIYWMEDIISLMDTFADIEAEEKWHYSQQEQESNCSLAIKLLGLALQDDTKRFVNSLRNNFSYKLHHPRLSKWEEMTFCDKMNKYLSEKLKHRLDETEEKESTADWFYYNVLHPIYGRNQLRREKTEADAMLLLASVHYSQKYSTEQFYNMEEAKIVNLLMDFHDSFFKEYSK